MDTDLDHLIQLQLLNLNFLLMRQVSNEYKCGALREAERELILKRLYQLQQSPAVNGCKSSLKMLSHLQTHWQKHCEQTMPRPANQYVH